jgi:hypothetical protein
MWPWKKREPSPELLLKLYYPGIAYIFGKAVADEDEHSALAIREVLGNYDWCMPNPRPQTTHAPSSAE